MFASEAELCNLALARIGQREFIDSLAEESVASRVCAVLYPAARDSALSQFPWPFARGEEALPLLANVERLGWEYVYSLPQDYLAARRLWSGARVDSASTRIPYSVEHDASYGRILCTDLEDAELIYTAQVKTPARFPPEFADALAWLIASDLALALTLKPDLSKYLLDVGRKRLREAAAADCNQQGEDQEYEAEHIRER